ncbi:MAG: long-chain fatty acid--CoA ligase, partial [Actinobacteria bacterium]|nr:long-chain fatty acid--CoA ligase [Actinomycetota bacterium]
LRGDGSVRTGDLGRIDLKGRLVLVGRATERYVRGGYNVYPMEVESVLAEHPAIQAVAVAGRPDEVMGEAGVAVVVARSGQSPPSLEEIHRFARDRLAAYKLPAEVMTVPALPLTAMEKLDRRALAQMVSRSAT